MGPDEHECEAYDALHVLIDFLDNQDPAILDAFLFIQHAKEGLRNGRPDATGDGPD